MHFGRLGGKFEAEGGCVGPGAKVDAPELSLGPVWEIEEVSRVGAQGVTSKSKLLAREMPRVCNRGLRADSGESLRGKVAVLRRQSGGQAGDQSGYKCVRKGVKEGEATKVCDERCVERNNMSALLVVLQPLTTVRHPRLPTRVAPTRCARCASKSAPPPPPPPLPPTPPTRRLPRLPQTRHAISGTCCTQRRTGRGAHH